VRRHFTYCWPQKVGTFLPQSAVTAVLDNAHILFLSFRRVLNVICSFLGNSPASEF